MIVQYMSGGVFTEVLTFVFLYKWLKYPQDNWIQPLQTTRIGWSFYPPTLHFYFYAIETCPPIVCLRVRPDFKSHSLLSLFLWGEVDASSSLPCFESGEFVFDFATCSSTVTRMSSLFLFFLNSAKSTLLSSPLFLHVNYRKKVR